MDRLHVVLPDTALGRIQLRASRLQPILAQAARGRAPGAVGRIVGVSAGRARRCLEAHGRRDSRAADSGAVGFHDRTALLFAIHDRSAVAGQLSPRNGPRAVPALFAVEYRLVVGTVDLPLCVRATVHVADADSGLVGRLCAVRGAVRVVRVGLRADLEGGTGARGTDGGRNGQSAAAERGEDTAVAGAGGLRIGDVVGHHQPALSGSHVGAVFVGVAAIALPVHVYHLFRSRALVSPGRVLGAAGGRGVAGLLRDDRGATA